MSKKSIIILIIIFLLFSVFSYFVGFYTGKGLSSPIEPFSSSKFKLLTEVAEYIEERFVDKKTEIDLCRGLVKSLDDPYSEFYTPDEFASFQEETRGEYVGIGVLIGVREGKVKILMVFKNSPAKEVGLPEGAYIMEVDGKNIKGMTLDEVANLVKGKEGTYVDLKVEKDGKLLSFHIQRRKVTAESVMVKRLNEDIGYMKIIFFIPSTPGEVKEAFNKLKGMKGLILDLRGNPGGLLSSVEGVAGYFIPEGPLLYIQRKDEKEERVSRGPGIKIPLVVLIDENTASAAEILSGAIKDRNVGTLVGTKTYGKGVIQTIFNLSDGYGLKITTERYLTPNMYSLDKKGIEPDIEVKYTDEDLKKGVDPQLNKALEIIKEKIGE